MKTTCGGEPRCNPQHPPPQYHSSPAHHHNTTAATTTIPQQPPPHCSHHHNTTAATTAILQQPPLQYHSSHHHTAATTAILQQPPPHCSHHCSAQLQVGTLDWDVLMVTVEVPASGMGRAQSVTLPMESLRLRPPQRHIAPAASRTATTYGSGSSTYSSTIGTSSTSSYGGWGSARGMDTAGQLQPSPGQV